MGKNENSGCLWDIVAIYVILIVGAIVKACCTNN